MVLTFIAFSILLFILVGAYNYDGDVQIAFIKGILFGFTWDNLYIEDEEVTVHTFQAGIGFILLNLTYERDGRN